MSEKNIAIIRIRGRVNVNIRTKDAMKMIGLNRLYSMIILPKNEKTTGIFKKIMNHVTWGDVSDVVLKELDKKFGDKKVYHLRSPKGGLKAIKIVYPKGDLGNRGEKINDLILRMI